MREPKVLNWPGGEHAFLLRIGGLLALEQACDVGVGAIFERLSIDPGRSAWCVLDVTETLRLGLIDGGMDRQKAQRLVETTADRVGLLTLVPVARAVLLWSLVDLSGADEADEAAAPEKKRPRRRAASKGPT